MASLSHSERTSSHDENPNNYPEGNREEWLELGLGFDAPKKQEEDHQPNNNNNNPNIPTLSFITVSASAASHHAPVPPASSGCGTGLELGLSLGIDSEYSTKAPMLYHQLDHDEEEEEDDDDNEPGYNYDDDDDDMAWWWPCQMNISSGSCLNDWQMPVPNNTHHYLPRPHSAGFWFTLHSYTNRNGEALPQIPKAYIRVKEENVTIFMVKKYLVRKLGLSNEDEVEISCMGQRLLHTQTLEQVRDCVWLPSFNNYYSLQTNSVNNHLMSLYYARQSAFN